MLDPAGIEHQQISASGSGEDYAETTDAFLDTLQAGWLMTFYYGHGVVTGWHLLPNTRVQELEALDRLPILFAEACSSAQFTNPAHQSLAERVLLMPDGGTIAYVGATTRVWRKP